MEYDIVTLWVRISVYVAFLVDFIPQASINIGGTAQLLDFQNG